MHRFRAALWVTTGIRKKKVPGKNDLLAKYLEKL
jgi:hypothetical protein